MECKDRYKKPRHGSDYGINRNIMECKDKTGIPVQKLNLVLIETLWNVKEF